VGDRGVEGGGAREAGDALAAPGPLDHEVGVTPLPIASNAVVFAWTAAPVSEPFRAASNAPASRPTARAASVTTPSSSQPEFSAPCTRYSVSANVHARFCDPAACVARAPRTESGPMKARGRSTRRTVPPRTQRSTTCGTRSMAASRQTGHWRSTYSVSVAGADALPSVIPCWGTPASIDDAWPSALVTLAFPDEPPATLIPTSTPTTTSAATMAPPIQVQVERRRARIGTSLPSVSGRASRGEAGRGASARDS
jgi:hypothetical protein